MCRKLQKDIYKLGVESILENKLGIKPQIKSLNIYADQIDNNKLFGQLSKTHKAMNTNNNIKNIDLSGLSIKNGNLEIKTMTIKSMIANNFRSAFSIDEKGIFHADNTSVQVGEGIASVTGSTDPVALGGSYAITASPKTGYTFNTWTAEPAANATFADL